jgi:hypothetical protein
VHRALLSSLGIALVVTADAAVRSPGTPWPLVFVGYSLLIWGVLPVVVTLARTTVAGHASNAELPMWLTATVAALATAAWVSWGVGPGHGELTYGLVQRLRAAGTSLALGTRWRMPTRVIVRRRSPLQRR